MLRMFYLTTDISQTIFVEIVEARQKSVDCEKTATFFSI
jgi:hypothetical protein